MNDTITTFCFDDDIQSIKVAIFPPRTSFTDLDDKEVVVRVGDTVAWGDGGKADATRYGEVLQILADDNTIKAHGTARLFVRFVGGSKLFDIRASTVTAIRHTRDYWSAKDTEDEFDYVNAPDWIDFV